ncbi:MAG: hypothetical protein AAF589_05030 [Planctomycetota bacterium]
MPKEQLGRTARDRAAKLGRFVEKIVPTALAIMLAAIAILVGVGNSLLTGNASAAEATAPAAGEAVAPSASDNKPAEPPELGEQWVRVAYDKEDEPRAMQVAIVRYRGKASGKPVVVDLIGAVHVGDAAYYRQLNKRFEQYDALLYELVAPQGTVVRADDARSSSSVVGSMQNGMKSMLKLEHQLEKIDYTKANFVHADMSPDEFMKSMKDRKESFIQMYFRMLGQGLATQSRQQAKGKSVDFDMMQALFAPDRARRLKIVFAEQMTDMESLLGGMGGEAGSTLITERNKAAFDVLRRELDAGKELLGVFYGAGHLTDMDKRLRNDFSLLPEEITWLDAWNLSAN